MKCPRCTVTDIWRVARQGMGDHFRRLLEQWPYECRACGCRFYLSQRNIERAAPAQPAEDRSVDYRARKQQVKAEIVVRADTPDQLNNILLALSQAVAREQESYSAGGRMKQAH